MEQETTYHPLPQPEEIAIKEKEDAMGAYLMMFAAIGAGLPLPIINLIASIIYFYLFRTATRFVRFHCYQSLISQLPITVMNAVGVFWALRIFISVELHPIPIFWGYLWSLLAANLAYFIIGIVAAVKARRGRMFYYWLFGKIAYHHVFRIRPETMKSPEKNSNLPPSL